MASEFRIVIDTGVVVSAALLPGSAPRQAVDRALALGRLLVSSETLFELDDVLRRPKFDKYVTEEHRLELLAALVHQAELVEITERIRECRDSQDDKFLELAVCGNASHHVTGDADLLCMSPYREIRILTPAEFVVAEWSHFGIDMVLLALGLMFRVSRCHARRRLQHQALRSPVP